MQSSIDSERLPRKLSGCKLPLELCHT